MASRRFPTMRERKRATYVGCARAARAEQAARAMAKAIEAERKREAQREPEVRR